MGDVAVSLGCRGEVPLTKISLEQLDCHSINNARSCSVVSCPFVSHKRVSTVELVPAENSIGVGQGVVNGSPTFTRDVRILTAKHNQQFAADLRNSIQRIILEPFPETSFVNVSRITASRCKHFPVH